jgi:succinoglycan biosynthesis transport protein ExoP
MEFRQFLKVIYRYKYMIIVMCFSATVTATLLTYILSERYQSSTKLLIRPQKSINLVPKREEILNFPVSYITPVEMASKTYTEIIKSRFIAERVVNLLGTDKIKEEEGVGWHSFWKKAKAKLKDLFIKGWIILKYGQIREEDPYNRAVTEVKKSLSVKPTKETYLFELQAEAKSPLLASAIANTTAKVFVDYFRDVDSFEREKTKRLSEEKLNLSREQLDEAKRRLVEFKEKHGIVSIKKEMELELELLSGFEKSLESVNVAMKGAIAKREEIKRQLVELERFSKSATKVVYNPLVRELHSQLAEKEVKLAGLNKRYTSEHKEVQALQAEIDEIKAKLKQEDLTLKTEETSSIDPVFLSSLNELARVETFLESQKAESNRLALAIQEKKRLLEQMPQKEIELSKLELAVSLNEETHRLLSKEYEEQKIAADRDDSGDIRVVQVAFPPLYPTTPIKIYYAALAGILSLIIGMGVALLMEYMDGTIRSIEEAEHELGLPVLMTIPRIRLAQGASWPLIETQDGTLSTLPLPHFEEPICGLRSHLQLFRSPEMASFLIASCGPQEGKSIIIANLAVSLVSIPKRVVLVDANLTSPSVHKIFDLPNQTGLSNILLEDEQPHLQKHKSGLSILTSGPLIQDPSASLGSDKMVRLFEQLKNDFEFTLIDSSPLLAGLDTALLASIVHGTILIIDSGRTSVEDGKRAKKILERAHAKILGLVLNNYNESKSYHIG